MPKHNLRKSFKSFFLSHVDPNKDEQLKGTKSEMEGKVRKILNALKMEDDEDGKEKLVGMIEDFQNQYCLLFDRYDHLTEALRRRAHARRGNNSSSSSSDSDSGSDGSPNLRVSNDSTKQELEIAESLIKENEATSYSTGMGQLKKRENEVLQLELEEKREAISALEEGNNSLSSMEEPIREEIIEDLKRDLEMKDDEVITLVENLRNAEVKLRLTSQKLRITEQSLTEKEDSQRSKEKKLQEEKKLLQDKVETNKKVQSDMAKEITEKVNDMMTGFDSFNVKFEECYGRLEFRLYEVVDKIGIVTNWIKESTGEKDQLKKEISNYINQLKDEKEQGLLLRSKVEELEKIVKQGKGKMTELERMIKERDARMDELETEMIKKEVGISSLAEQKREAIKQLCIWIEYHRNRYDDLVSKTTRRRRQSCLMFMACIIFI